MDNKMIRKGATLYLPVYCEGALLGIGDLHAAMGDGEIMVSGVEVSGTVTVEVEVIKNVSLGQPFLENETHFYTIASSENMLDAVKKATDDMVDLVSKVYHLSFNEAGMLMSAIGNVEVCQVVDPLLTVRFGVPKSLIKINANALFGKE